MINLTDLFLILSILIVAVADLIFYAYRGEEATESWRIAYWTTRAPIFGVIVGTILGHLFWPNHFYCP